MVGSEIRRYGLGLAVVGIIIALAVIIKYAVSGKNISDRQNLVEVSVEPIEEVRVTAKKRYIGYVIPINDVIRLSAVLWKRFMCKAVSRLKAEINC